MSLCPSAPRGTFSRRRASESFYRIQCTIHTIRVFYVFKLYFYIYLYRIQVPPFRLLVPNTTTATTITTITTTLLCFAIVVPRRLVGEWGGDHPSIRHLRYIFPRNERERESSPWFVVLFAHLDQSITNPLPIGKAKAKTKSKSIS